MIQHAGTTRGFESSLARYPEKDLLVIVLSNERETCSSTSFALAMTAAGFDHGDAPVGVTLAPETLQQCEGLFVAGKSAEIVVRTVGSRLALDLSPEAVVLLTTGQEAKTLSRDAKKTERIARIVERMRAEDMAGLSPFVSPDWKDGNRTLVRTWRELAAELGAYERSEVLGTHRASDYLEAFVRVDFDAGRGVIALLFRDELLESCEVGAGLPSGAAFVARSETEFAWLDPTSHGSRSCVLLVEHDVEGRATMITIKAVKDTLQARRKK